MDIKQQCKESYERLENLKLVGDEVGIPWQTVYVHLKSLGVPVKGNKSRYGSEADRFAAKAEKHFAELIPHAVDMNKKEFQAKYDFKVSGMKVDVKSSRLHKQSKHSEALRWSFSTKVQECFADFIVGIAYKDGEPAHYFLFPCDVVRFLQSISVSQRGGKWWDFEINKDELLTFFKQVAAA